jgi:hypothetical protein
VKGLLQTAALSFKGTIPSRSVHAAALQPGRAVAWLEGAAKLPVEDCMELVELFPALLNRECQVLKEYPSTELPGLVTVAQWKDGAVQLQREVRAALSAVCVCV